MPVVSMNVLDNTSVAFDVEAFDEACQAQGVRFVHYRAMRNPVGMLDVNDPRRVDPDHSGSSNGMLYTKAGCIAALFTGNSKDLRAAEGGMLNSATAQITPARHYVCTAGEQVFLAPMDRLYLEEESILVNHQQLVQAHETGVDKLKFPVLKVLDLVDANNVRYSCGQDFDIVDGRIKWTKTRRPGINAEMMTGTVYAVRYLYRPYWYVDRLMHEIRVAQQEDPYTGQRKTVMLPQSAMIQREYIFENEDKDEQATDPKSPRQVRAPADGGFGPR